MLKSTVALDTGTGILKDIQIWNDIAAYQEPKKLLLTYQSHVKYRRIPLFLVYCGSSEIFTKDSQTERYFYNTLILGDSETGVLAKVNNSDKHDAYVVFFKGHDNRIKCVFIDLLLLQHAHRLRLSVDRAAENVLYPVNLDLMEATKSDTSVFDRVLEGKSKKFSVANPQLQNRPLDLTSSQQITQTVNKVILSGLRLRGLSSTNTDSSNERYAVREVFQMTKKSTMFALRKFSYDFNGSQGKKPTLEAIQDIVESLLLTFVDIETITFNRHVSTKHTT